MYIVLYRWRIKPGTEKTFVTHWEQVTKYFMNEHGALGSRLHLSQDGTHFAYAQWPSIESYESAKALSTEHQESINKMNHCILESLPQIKGLVLMDLLDQGRN